MTPIKEVCVESFSEALQAVKAGASRIELCENLAQGGTTPSFGTIRHCIEKINVPVMVMIRPRGGNFCYSADEYEIMRQDILQCKQLGVVGVVFGLLDAAGLPDLMRTSQLVALAAPMEVTFHKAIDETDDLPAVVKQLKATGIRRILTSGGKPTALEGSQVLQQMIIAALPEINIIVAGKVTWENFEDIRQLIPCDEYHGRKLVRL